MSGQPIIYPATPVNVPESVTRVSPAFKKEVSGVMGSILLFLFVYLLMFVIAIGLVAACVAGGIGLIVAVPRLLTIIIGLGLIGLGIMVFIFLVKFLFAVSRYDKSGSIEIREAEQPVLFAFIRQLTADVQTPFPKKIYLSPDVNAAVFYNSGFWSMFLPVKKNLQIGLGLVNALNVSEFKAVMAHEFGHFSQRSMKLGSFVYNVNKVIHNMLFENRSYSSFLQGWANMHGIFAFFAQVTAAIAQGIQWVLGQMYAVINKSYMRLSREMEFHADAVAASVSGSRNLATALRRVELAGRGYSIVIEKCDDLFRQKKISDNIYQNQKSVLKYLAREFNLTMEHDIPVVSENFIRDNTAGRINYKDQWASHPATEDRIKHLDDLAVEAEIMTDPAWVLFERQDELQKMLTGKVYEKALDGTSVTTINAGDFEEKFYSDINRFEFPPAYNGFYDNRQVTIASIEWMSGRDASDTNFEKLFSAENASLQKKINATAHDIEVVKAINEKRLAVKTFDFDGVKHKSSEAAAILATLEEEQSQQEAALKQLDRQAICFFLRLAAAKSMQEEESLRNEYLRYFEKRREADAYLKDIRDLLESIRPVFAGQSLPIEQINTMIGALKSGHEIKLKNWLKQWKDAAVFDPNPQLQERVVKFIDSSYAYFSGSSFFDEELIELNALCNESWEAVNIFIFDKFKSILERQIRLVNNH